MSIKKSAAHKTWFEVLVLRAGDTTHNCCFYSVWPDDDGEAQRKVWGKEQVTTRNFNLQVRYYVKVREVVQVQGHL